MSNEKIVAAAKRLVPGAQINMIGDSLESLKWLDTRPRPTDAEILAEMDNQPAIDAMAAFQDAIEAHVEATARERDYSSAVSLASYVGSTVATWAAEAQAFVEWRDKVWQKVYADLDEVQSGEREQPTVEAFLADLPAIVWPKGE